MGLKVIGAGFGRTGTTSMKDALEILGYQKCHHMKEVMKEGEQVEQFDRLSQGLEVNWDDIFEGFEAAVDWPSSARYQELMVHYPDAKVILTARDAEAWYKSATDTIYAVSRASSPVVTFLIPKVRKIMTMINRLVWEGVFDGRFEDKDHAIKIYNDNIAEVMQHVPSDRLLVHSSKEGWEPLCAFLDKPIPNEAYPHSNETKELKREIGRAHV